MLYIKLWDLPVCNGIKVNSSIYLGQGWRRIVTELVIIAVRTPSCLLNSINSTSMLEKGLDYNPNQLFNTSWISHVSIQTWRFQLFTCPLLILKDIVRQLNALDSFGPEVQIILSKMAITEEGRKITSSHIHSKRVCYRIHSISPSCFCVQESGGSLSKDKQGPTWCRMIYTIWIDEYFHLNAKY